MTFEGGTIVNVGVAQHPTGVEAVKQMLNIGNLQKVAPSGEAATTLLDAAETHLESALAIAESDPDRAYSLLYDAARKSLAALSQTQGAESDQPRRTLRDPGGGRCTIHEAATVGGIQIVRSATAGRNQIEYDDISSITSEDVIADIETVR